LNAQPKSEIATAAKHPVDQARGQRPSPGVAPCSPAAGRNVGARLHRRDQPRQVLRRVLEISVHRHDDLAARADEARVHCRVLAEVPLQTHAVDSGVLLVQPLDHAE
jgi:hypothetical protein